MSEYHDFLSTKGREARPSGFPVDESTLNGALFPWQRQIVAWALGRGRAALFSECGTGKTAMQLEWARRVCAHSGGSVLVLAPLAVAQQTRREGEKFGIPVTVCRSQADARPGVNVANYEMLEHFDCASFAGVVLDESSILKSYMGKTKRALLDAFSATPYRLACTATPAPNDHVELGNHAEFLGVMPANEMLSRWFINDTSRTGVYRLKGHAAADFWAWVASWAVSLRRPSDLGYPDDGFQLPELRLHQVDVRVDLTDESNQRLFRLPDLNATEIQREHRRTAQDRVDAAAALVNDDDDVWIVWCHTNQEADLLKKAIPDAVEVRGSESAAVKERKLTDFGEGRSRTIVTKPSIAGWGLNWQHCHKVVFVGLSYSFEELYQAIRRSYRFGQREPVDVYLIVAETEGAVLATVRDKMAAHEAMLEAMTAAVARRQRREDLTLAAYDPRTPMRLPDWLRSVA